MTDPQAWLAAVTIDPAVHELRPDYVAVVLVAENVTGGPSDSASEALLTSAEARTREFDGTPPHVESWREAYRAFGAKPQRTRPSVDALLRRVGDGLPRIDRITDAYNAVSISHAVPLGGEDLDAYVGPARLTRADGTEDFDTTKEGADVVEHPEAGEVVWRDDTGVTCRRWNWRQCTRTRLTTATTRAFFVLDGLDPLGVDGTVAAADALQTALETVSPGVVVARRVLTA
ncbi:B3/B4 domain-containing protein [Jatrophihabitans sp. YIM 134969]